MESNMKKIGMICLALLASAMFVAAAQAEIKIGIVALRGAPKVMEEWAATGEYLSGRVCKEFCVNGFCDQNSGSLSSNMMLN